MRRNRKVRQALTWARGVHGWEKNGAKARERKGKKMEELLLAELTISRGFVRMRGGFAAGFMGSDGAL